VLGVLPRRGDLAHVLARELGEVDVDVAVVVPAPEAEVQEDGLLPRRPRGEGRSALLERAVELSADRLELAERVRPRERVVGEASAGEEKVGHPDERRLAAALEAE